ncbi:MAG: hypothetical protein WBL27_00670 [Salinimicrobium sp.]
MEKGLKKEVIAANSSTLTRSLSWIFAVLVFTNGLLNLIRGNDPALGIAFILLSIVYIPPFSRFFNRYLGFGIPFFFKLLLAIAIIWVSLAVGAIPEGFYPEILS